MTRISLVDLEQGRGREEHCIILMDPEERRVRDRSLESEARESPPKRHYNYDEESLVFETRLVDCEGEEQTVGAIGMVAEEACKLTWKHFRNYMIRNGGIEKNFARKNEVKVFYIDDEEDEIFVDTDDEYRELLKIASAKNKSGETMILKFVSISKTRRSQEARRRSCGDRKVDLLGRELKTSPGKVMKHQNKHFDTVGGKIWKINGGKNVLRGKIPGKMVPIFGREGTAKPVTIAEGLNEVKELSRSLEEVKISPCRRLFMSPETTELQRQQASIFDWMNKAASDAEQDSPPSWFAGYMENFKDELAAEITTKVVHNLGIIIENKLAGLLEKKSEARVDESEFAKKIHRGKDKVKKVKSEAMRMTMELGEESKESKELKKLKRSLIKKTDKVVKVAMKIEKKNHQEFRGRKNSLSSSNTAEQLQILKLTEKKEKKEKTKEEKKVAKIKVKKSRKREESEEDQEKEVTPTSLVQDYPLTPLHTYPLTPVASYPLVPSPTHRSVVTVQPRGSSSLASSLSEELETRQQLEAIIAVPRRGERDSPLPGAVFLSINNQLALVARPQEKVVTKISMINMGCLTWGSEATIQRTLSSEGLLCPSSCLALPPLQPGQEGSLTVPFTAPSSPGQYESVWHFWLGPHRFGPPLKFKVEVADRSSEPLALPGTELKDYAGPGEEMRALGVSALEQEMVVMSGARGRWQFDNTYEDFDLLAEEVDSLTLESVDSEEDFEVIPVPDCFNLEVPFEVVGEEVSNKEEECEAEESSALEGKTPLEEALVAVKAVQEKLGKAQEVSSGVEKLSVAAVEEASLARLVELGFANRAENVRLLRQSEHSMERVLKKLFENSSASWAERRH